MYLCRPDIIYPLDMKLESEVKTEQCQENAHTHWGAQAQLQYSAPAASADTITNVHKLPMWVLLLTPLFFSHLTAPDHQQAHVCSRAGGEGAVMKGGGASLQLLILDPQLVSLISHVPQHGAEMHKAKLP